MLEDIRLSFKGIWSHKMRSFLTMLGIIVGIAAVISIVSTITGTNEQIKNNLIGDGTNTVKVELYQNNYQMEFSYSQVPSGVPELGQDVLAEVLNVRHVENASAYHVRTYCESVFYLNSQASGATVYGIDGRYFETVGMQITSGRGFSRAELDSQKKMAVVDRTIADSLFSGVDPVGKTIDIMGEPFTVVGVADKKNEFEPTITSIDDYYTYKESSSGCVYIPDNIWPLVFMYDEPRNFIVKASSTDTMTSAGKDTAEILNSYLSVSEDSNVQYKSTNLAEEAAELQQLSSSTNIMLVGIASISLLVGGIGVMNIMLVSVTERTREIGLKKALGARKSRIQRQFLTEAVILSGIGGVFGIVVGIVAAKVISLVAEIPTVISPASIIIAVAFSMVIGIIFGLLPSVKASKLNPIDALRYE